MDHELPGYPSFFLSINGRLCAFFKGIKGLRKGGPIYSLIFGGFGIFHKDLKKMGSKEGLSYRYRCASLEFNYLIFADDLMLFCKGDISSVILMVRAMRAFSLASGFHANNDKTTLYFGNVKDEMQQKILQATGFTSREKVDLHRTWDPYLRRTWIRRHRSRRK